MASANDISNNPIDCSCGPAASSCSLDSGSRGRISFSRKEWIVLVTATVVAVFGITAGSVSSNQSASAAESSSAEHVHPVPASTSVTLPAAGSTSTVAAASTATRTVTTAATTPTAVTRVTATAWPPRAATPRPAPRPTTTKPSPSTTPASPRGLVVSFGTYQGAPITWRVLEASDGELLLLADRVLSAGAFQTDWEQDDANAYATSEVSRWLESTFAISAFSAEESAALLPHAGGVTAGDRVFLLTAAELKRYLSAASDRRAKPRSEAAASETGFSGEVLALTNGYAAWWLADAVGSNAAQTVQADGTITGQPVYYADLGVRPAIRVDRTKIALALSAQGVE